MQENHLTKLNNDIYVKNTEKARNKGTFLILLKTTSGIPRDNIILNGKILNDSPPKIRDKQRCLLLPFLFNIVLKISSGKIRQ